MKKKRDRSGAASPGQSADYVVGQVSGSLSQESAAASGSSLSSLFGAAAPAAPVRFQPAAKVVQRGADLKALQKEPPEVKGQSQKRKQPREKTEADQKLEDRERSLQTADEDERGRETSVKRRRRKEPSAEDGVEHWAVARQRLKARKEEEKVKRKRTVFVGNLPPGCTKKTLQSLFRTDGQIESIRFRSVVRADPSMSRKVAAIQRKVHPKKQSMNAYVVFKDEGGVATALERNGLEIQEGFYIRLDRVADGSSHHHRRSAFVGNLPFDISDLAFRRHFEACGPVEAVRLVRDQNSGLGKGFGYVLFESADSVQLALKLDGSKLEGRSVRVKRSVKKEKQKDGGAGRAGGGARGGAWFWSLLAGVPLGRKQTLNKPPPPSSSSPCWSLEEEEQRPPGDPSWEVDQGLLARLKEQYRKERKGKMGVKRKSRAADDDDFLNSSHLLLMAPPPPPGPNRSKLQDMLANLRDVEDLPTMQPSTTPPLRPSGPRLNEPEDETMTVLPSPGTSFVLGRVDEAVSTELRLGELAGLTVANEADNLAYDMPNNKDALRRTWKPKFTLRSHLDSVRSLAFHPVEPVLVTASEDHTLKLWNLQKTTPTKKCAALDVEPVYTFRAHSGAALCVAMSSSGEQCFSGGVGGVIQSWNTPNPNVEPYDSYEPSVLRGALRGHTDVVWGVVYSSAHHRLLSCSADGTIRLWNAADTSPSLAVFNEQELGVPTSVDVVRSDPGHMVASFSTGHIGLFNMETQQLVLKLESSGLPEAPCRINKVLSHPTQPISITAQEDRHIQFFDNNTGKPVHSMVAHLDAVTSLAADPNGLYLMSGSHDCSVRLWDMESKTCVQEFTAHRKKFHESIHDVAFHPGEGYIGSAGADALAKVFV
ncbi:striatin-like [Brachionichthys hirsutus]|uniref:striatin-like n=1 Tax=Brachionichthys hirsutus TaxID=412623 RepID=UPI003605175E